MVEITNRGVKLAFPHNGAEPCLYASEALRLLAYLREHKEQYRKKAGENRRKEFLRLEDQIAKGHRQMEQLQCM